MSKKWKRFFGKLLLSIVCLGAISFECYSMGWKASLFAGGVCLVLMGLVFLIIYLLTSD